MAPASRSNTIRIGANYAQLGASFVIGLILVRLLLGLGEDVYGTIAVLAAGTGLARLLRDALQTGLVPILAEAWHRSAKKGSSGIASFRRTFAAAVVVATMAATVSLLLFLILDRLLSVLQIPNELRGAASLFVWCRAAQTFVAAIAAPWLTMILVREKMVTHNGLILAERLIELTAAVFTLYWVGGSESARALVSFAIIASAGSITLHATTAMASMIRQAHFRPVFRATRADDLRQLIPSFGWNVVQTLSMNLHLRLDVVLMNSFFGVAAGMLFSIAGQATSYLRQLTMGLVGGIDALAARHRVSDQPRELHDLAHRQMNLQALIVFPAAATIIIAAEPLLARWLSGRLDNPLESLPEIALFCRLLVIGVVARSLSESWIATLTGTNHTRRFAPFVLAGALLNPLVIYIGIRLLPEDFGRIVPALSFSAILAMVHLGLIPRVTAKVLGLRTVDLFRPCAIPGVAAVLATIASCVARAFDAATSVELVVFLSCYASVLLLARIRPGKRPRRTLDPS